MLDYFQNAKSNGQIHPKSTSHRSRRLIFVSINFEIPKKNNKKQQQHLFRLSKLQKVLETFLKILLNSIRIMTTLLTSAEKLGKTTTNIFLKGLEKKLKKINFSYWRKSKQVFRLYTWRSLFSRILREHLNRWFLEVYLSTFFVQLLKLLKT